MDLESPEFLQCLQVHARADEMTVEINAIQPEGPMLAELRASTCEGCGQLLSTIEVLGASIRYCGICGSNRLKEQAPAPTPAWRRAGIPAHFAEASFKQWRPWVGKKWPARADREGLFLSTTEEAVALVKRLGAWQGWDSPGFMIGGTPGRGKTQLACAYLVRELAAGRPGRFISDAAVAQLLRADFRTPQYVRGRALVELACTTPVLVYDDVLMGDNAVMARTIILARHAHRLPTLFTCQYPGTVLRQKLDETPEGPAPIYGRLREMCGLNWTWQTGPDLRLEEK